VPKFSLSPSVQVTEFDNSQYIQNLPSSKTGMVLRADSGPCNKIIPIANEADLVYWFGTPNASNYLDWFNAWNFLQYARNLYVSRPTNTTVQNAGVGLTGFDVTFGGQTNLYNTEIADVTLKNAESFISVPITGKNNRINFFNRFVTSAQKVGLAVCSTSTYWKAPIANEFVAKLTSNATTNDINTINDFGGIPPEGTTSLDVFGTKGVDLTILPGSKFKVNSNKLYTVTNVYNNGVSNSVSVNKLITPADLALYVGTLVTTGNVNPGSSTITFSTTNLTLQRFSIVKFAANQFYYVNTINYETGNVSFIGVPGHFTSTAIAMPASVYSNTDYFTMQLSSDYSATASGVTTYTVPAGTSNVKVVNDFNFPVGTVLKFQTNSNTYSGLLTDTFPNESGSSEDNYQIVEIDTNNNIITLDRELTLPISTTTPLFDDINVNIVAIKGINLHSTIYDDSLIMKTKTTVLDVEDGVSKEVYVEELLHFNKFFDYEPDWVADEFVTIIFSKNTAGKYEFAEAKLASYNSAARDHQGKNIFADEVFYYGSKYVYCKVTEDETLNKADTSVFGLVKFRNVVATIVDSAILYGTTYPVKHTTNSQGQVTAITKAINGIDDVYDPFGYTIGDIQNASDVFNDAELFDINLLIAHELDLNYMSTIAENRKDCLAIVAPYEYVKLVGKPATTATSSLLDEFGTQTVYGQKKFNTYGTYSAIYGNMKYQYDRYNDVNRWVCVAGDIAGLAAQTDDARDPWWAFAGLSRGKIKNVIKLALNPNKQNRDELYVNAINPIMTITGEGVGIVFGQKTATAKASALDRINVRRLLITIEKALASAVKYGIFEFNDSFTRNRLVGMIDPFLRNVKARRGVYWYAVKCDATNNTPFIIDNNGLVIDVAVQPTKTAEFIQLNIFINKTGDITFGETVG
jgi:hypothetical protein